MTIQLSSQFFHMLRMHFSKTSSYSTDISYCWELHLTQTHLLCLYSFVYTFPSQYLSYHIQDRTASSQSIKLSSRFVPSPCNYLPPDGILSKNTMDDFALKVQQVLMSSSPHYEKQASLIMFSNEQHFVLRIVPTCIYLITDTYPSC